MAAQLQISYKNKQIPLNFVQNKIFCVYLYVSWIKYLLNGSLDLFCFPTLQIKILSQSLAETCSIARTEYCKFKSSLLQLQERVLQGWSLLHQQLIIRLTVSWARSTLIMGRRTGCSLFSFEFFIDPFISKSSSGRLLSSSKCNIIAF